MDTRPDRTHSRTPAPARRISGTSDAARERFRALNLTMMLPVLTVVGALVVTMEAQTWWHAVILGLGVAAALVAFVQWSAGGVLRVAIPCLVVTAAVWPFGALVVDSHPETAFYGLALVGSLIVPRLPRHRAAAAVVLAGYVAAVGLAGLMLNGQFAASDVVSYIIVPAGVTVVTTGLMFPNKRFYDVVAELEESSEREAELAVIRERVRFASDLHDIQGHTLHVVKLKIALAQRLLHIDTQRVEQELREMYELVGDTISQTKELAYAQRRLNLSAELENAKNLFEAAGIRVAIDRASEVNAGLSELLGQVLRETTTNILRHSQATQVRISLWQNGISILNNGVKTEVLPEISGLGTLKHRLSEEGGELTVELKDGHFLTSAAFATTAHRSPDVVRSAR